MLDVSEYTVSSLGQISELYSEPDPERSVTGGHRWYAYFRKEQLERLEWGGGGGQTLSKIYLFQVLFSKKKLLMMICHSCGEGEKCQGEQQNEMFCSFS